jgi:histidinol phosphatase-like PHP family hydrolase
MDNFPVIDLHTHTIFSDGELCPAELAQRARLKGYRVLGISDHADQSNLEEVIKGARIASESLTKAYPPFQVLCGVELTHVPPSQLIGIIAKARALGSMYVVVHGETPVEPVEPGTNYAAILGGCDILAHPGFLSSMEAKLAAEKGVYLEISARKGHSLTNGHVVKMARENNARLIINSDAHSPSDILTPEFQKNVALGAGLDEEEYILVMEEVKKFTKRISFGLTEILVSSLEDKNS